MDGDKFTYSYSPSRNSEVDRITAKYFDTAPDPDSDLERLKKLDRQAELPGTMAGIVAGLAGVLMLGLGLSFILSLDFFAAGVIIGVCGLALMALAPVISKAVTRRSRERVRDEILALGKRIKGE
ncbi:MAG: hypothetical protein IJ737_03715 [Ruminococcus sp.]|nr:hypothetical protein [Ruminococcus sp.]